MVECIGITVKSRKSDERDHVENAADEIDNDNVVAEQEIKEVQPETKAPDPEKESNQREASDIEAEFFNK